MENLCINGVEETKENVASKIDEWLRRAGAKIGMRLCFAFICDSCYGIQYLWETFLGRRYGEMLLQNGDKGWRLSCL